MGDSTLKDFNILYHVREKAIVEKKENNDKKKKGGKKKQADDEEPDSEEEEEKMPGIDDDDKTYNRRVVPAITELWLKISPDREALFRDLMKCIADGIIFYCFRNYILNFQ
jgi:hypothetical protein